MLRRAALVIAVLSVLTGAGVWAYPREAECAYCYSGTCYNSSICGQECVCLKENNSQSGRCVSFD